ncbi:hypothetical protein ES288_A05G432700v1 [Gossypium darwinii]|uniref:Receptor-like serine/threonine-protein kinase n=1 Tax=Gossypium darwinii TaxID=34276 RepID=A0A5D2GRX6_GOSDA|nr:hypothetical protein ES288_A05G432700v1 [Gossypium darwinii]
MAHLLQSDILFRFLLLSFHVIIIAQGNESNIIRPGSSLYAGKHPSSWPSSSGYFRFGFYPQGNGYAVGIWLVGRSENTTVWTANRDDPPVSSNATLEFTTQGRLLLRTEDGMEKIIIANLTRSVSVDAASMLDTGNFMLYQNRTVVWESFNFPTDTILGGQKLSGSHNQLISSVSRSNHSSGPYLLRMQDDGNLVAYANNPAELDPSDAYWATMTNGWYFSVLNLNERGVLAMYSLPKFQQENVLANLSATGNGTIIIYRATLDPDGDFRLYSHQLESNTISHKWQILNDECDAKGQCGLNSYCSSRGKDTECYCYPGFTFINENTKSLGCSQNFTIDGCVARKDLVIHYNITTLDNMSWAGDPYSVKPNLEKEDCKKACQEDCFCGGVLYSDPKRCSMYRLPLKYGKRHGNITTTAFIKFILGSSISPPPETSQIDKRRKPKPHFNYGLKHRVQNYEKLLENKSSVLTEQFTLRSFTFDELDEATHGFQDELGKGSFGTVYKGILPGDGKSKTIAVKRLEKVNEGETDQIRTEMTVIGRTNHRNLVRLLGFCVEGSRKLLVYEYLGNGSLANFLFNMNKRPEWKERARIALDVAKGILYLHEECEVCIIHCNLKPHNILLDDSLTAKISDFGLAKLLRPNQTCSTPRTKGTAWYSAPEWQRSGLVSVKVDVYSFGVILLEIICCRSNIKVQVCSADEILLSTWVYSCFIGGELNKLVEGEEEVDMKMVERFVKVGLWCIQDDPNLRPPMKNVILMLEGTMTLPVPPSPSLLL